MRHLVKLILLVLVCTVRVAITLALFCFIKILNYNTHCTHYFYLVVYFVLSFLKLRKINVTSF